jgi:LytS/YehU family sensor histidine kinase
MEYVIYEAKEKLIDVKKEIHFLNNYTQLINQHHNNLIFETEITGDHENLKISPLLLAGFIDNIAEKNVENEKRRFKLRLQFSGKEMTLEITRDSGKGSLASSMQDETLLRRLKELYPGRFSVSNSTKPDFFKLTIQLDEER